MIIQEFEPLVLGEQVVYRDHLTRHLITRNRCEIYTILARKEDSQGWFYSIAECETWLPHFSLVRLKDIGNFSQELSQQIADRVTKIKENLCES